MSIHSRHQPSKPVLQTTYKQPWEFTAQADDAAMEQAYTKTRHILCKTYKISAAALNKPMQNGVFRTYVYKQKSWEHHQTSYHVQVLLELTLVKGQYLSLVQENRMHSSLLMDLILPQCIK